MISGLKTLPFKYLCKHYSSRSLSIGPYYVDKIRIFMGVPHELEDLINSYKRWFYAEYESILKVFTDLAKIHRYPLCCLLFNIFHLGELPGQYFADLTGLLQPVFFFGDYFLRSIFYKLRIFKFFFAFGHSGLYFSHLI